MDDEQRLSADDFHDVADLSAYRDRNGDEADEHAENGSLEFAYAADFADVEEESARALLGDDDDVILAAGGILVAYGKGGAGKTTLTIDLAMHLAAGDNWLDVTLAQPVRVLLIENEGPRGMFRKKIRSKLDVWSGSNIDDRVLVLVEPWSRFSYARDDHRENLAAYIEQREIDVVVSGPVQRLGVEGGGTPEEVSRFIELIELTRSHLDRPCAFVFVHHENKAGTVSGAWEGVPDTLVHVTSQGAGRTRVYWEKVRWSSTLHGRVWHLVWGETDGYVLDDEPERTDDDLRLAILERARANPGGSWGEIKPGGKRATDQDSIRDQLLDEGQLVDVNPGRGYKLYVAEDAPVLAEQQTIENQHGAATSTQSLDSRDSDSSESHSTSEPTTIEKQRGSRHSAPRNVGGTSDHDRGDHETISRDSGRGGGVRSTPHPRNVGSRRAPQTGTTRDDDTDDFGGPF